MSTITSPRESVTNFGTPSSSRRPSIDGTYRSQPGSPRIPPQPKRNRTALRDYYNLNKGQQAAEPLRKDAADSEIPESELDVPGFDAQKYVQGVLQREELMSLLKIEGVLINEIKGLDGERKALVYDNYSKLISATDTIRKMRMNMDPLGPQTSTLSPAIAHIAETSASLAATFQRLAPPMSEDAAVRQAEEKREQQRRLVKWVLQAPKRLQVWIAEGKRDEALEEWKKVALLLDKWEGVGGVREVRVEGEKILGIVAPGK
ncbi:MAG: hypothetical protein M1829_006835 [Trizodia sp. TS-e1964]|nr:MAG: hypothetical protein M1829_006835 [Trizodia sp. TS-e1964]